MKTNKDALIAEFKTLLKKVKLDYQGKIPVYSVLRHVSQSGMQRTIAFYLIINNEPRLIDYYIENIADYKMNKRTEGLIVRGCGMDMGFSVVYNFSHCVFKDTKGIAEAGYVLNNHWL